jgi:hypothetical protein
MLNCSETRVKLLEELHEELLKGAC